MFFLSLGASRDRARPRSPRAIHPRDASRPAVRSASRDERCERSFVAALKRARATMRVREWRTAERGSRLKMRLRARDLKRKVAVGAAQLPRDRMSCPRVTRSRVSASARERAGNSPPRVRGGRRCVPRSRARRSARGRRPPTRAANATAAEIVVHVVAFIARLRIARGSVPLPARRRRRSRTRTRARAAARPSPGPATRARDTSRRGTEPSTT